jgi:hypothetical protein
MSLPGPAPGHWLYQEWKTARGLKKMTLSCDGLGKQAVRHKSLGANRDKSIAADDPDALNRPIVPRIEGIRQAENPGQKFDPLSLVRG